MRQLPAQEERVETGAIQFGDDWPGYFLRGDNAFFLAMTLQQYLNIQAQRHARPAEQLLHSVIEGYVKDILENVPLQNPLANEPKGDSVL